MKTDIDKIRDIYDEFGIDVNSVSPPTLQSSINQMAKTIIKLRKKANNGN